MITVPVHKDVYNYEPKVVMMLTKRTLVFSALAVACGLALYFLVTAALRVPSSYALYLVVIGTLPLWYLGFARPYDMKPETLAPFWLRQRFTDQKITYTSCAALAARARAEEAGKGYVTDAQPPIQPSYAKLRRTRGIEAYDPSEQPLG